MRRMMFVYTLGLLGAFLCLGGNLAAQKAEAGCNPPYSRIRWHDDVDKEQRNVLRLDGRADAFFQAGSNEEVNYFVTQALTRQVDALQCRIEADTLIRDQGKVGYVRGLERLLRNFGAAWRRRQFNAAYLPTALNTYEAAIDKDKRGESIEEIVDKATYDIGQLLVASQAFERNPGFRTARLSLLRKYCLLHPDRIFATLKDNLDLPFRDSMIVLAGYKYPRMLYDYAAANNRLGLAIRKVDDNFIRTVSSMATSGGSGQLYFPFLDNLIKGKMTLKDIDAVKNDGARYYKLLVKTRMDYVQRAMNGEKILELEALTKMLEVKGKEVFIKEINALHELPDAQRFRILGQLNAQELYYLVIAGETELYTSSYIKGIYPLMLSKTGNRGDSLLMSVGFDRFKKFIRMAAGYNTLSHFLSTFPDNKQAQTLMTAFVNNLERSTGLEDGVDVADSYASIVETAKPIAAEMLNNVKLNYDKNLAAGNKRGAVIYQLLMKLFQSATDSASNLSRELGIPPVYSISYDNLKSDSASQVVMQVYFYGDEDGRRNYKLFLPQYANASWKKVEDNANWIAFASTKGKPILIYANKPLDEESGALEKAQAALNSYLVEKGLSPTVVIHRGHSYYAPYTIEQLQPSAKIVFLGSCGGYHLIHDVLRAAPDAHIIASKQIGKQIINQPFMDQLNEKLRGGSNIDWIPFWNELRGKVGKVDGFDDYIPPHKNLGALFIKAYGIAMGEEESTARL
jgi:hypothetical protein